MNSLDALEGLKTQALSALASAASLEEIGVWEKEFLGRKGKLTEQARTVGQLPAAERPAFGSRVNEIKQELQVSFEARLAAVREETMLRDLAAGAVDVTLPGRPVKQGHLHLTTQSLRQLYAVFALMGFEVYEAPDVELEAYNFDLLNIPEYHPARDMWDTFWVKDAEGACRPALAAHAHITRANSRDAGTLPRTYPGGAAGQMLPVRADHCAIRASVLPAGGSGCGARHYADRFNRHRHAVRALVLRT